MSYLILVRHGQSIWNLENRFTGWVDVDLNDNGRAQAKKAGELIKEKKLNIDHYYSSFQLRAKNTLKIIQEQLNDYKKVKLAWQLNERHYGSLTGLNKDYIEEIENNLKNKNILISAHGNSIRALCKYLFNLDNNQISKLEIPTGNPLLIKFDSNNKILSCEYLDSERAKDLLVY